MKKILFVMALVVGLCLSTVVGNCALTHTETVTVTGTTGFAQLSFPNGLSFQFDDNLQPGEQLAVSWWIQNTGPCLLDVDVLVTKSGTPADHLVVEFKPDYKFRIAQLIYKNVGLVVRMRSDCPDWKQQQSFTVTVIFNSTVVPERTQWPGLKPDTY